MFFLFLSVIVIISRRPDAFTNPQFFAEDGHHWYATAHNLGFWNSLFLSSAGYLQTLSRIVGSISLLLPLYYAPLFFNLIALIIHLLPITYLLSYRLNTFPFSARIFVIISYLLLSNTSETYLNITNAQWYLAITSFLIIVAIPPTRKTERIADILLLLLSGLSGPFSLFQFLCSYLLVLTKKIEISSIAFQTVSLTALLQVLSLLFNASEETGRLTVHQLPMILDVWNIYSQQVVWGLLAGPHGYHRLSEFFLAKSILIPFVSILSIVISAYVFVKASESIKVYIIFATLLLVSSMLSPTVYADGQRSIYQVMAEASGIRYWLHPMLALLIIIVWGAQKKNPFSIKIISITCITILIIFQIKHMFQYSTFGYTRYGEYHWKKEVTEFESLPSGSKKVIFIHPPGWQMTLWKQ